MDLRESNYVSDYDKKFKCPVCDSEYIEFDKIDADYNGTYCFVSCDDCKAIFKETWNITNCDILKDGIADGLD